MPWKSVGRVISHRFKKSGKGKYSMLPTGDPTNRALFVTHNESDFVEIIETGHIVVGNRVFTFKKWSPMTTMIPIQAIRGRRWIHVWRLPLPDWNFHTFQVISAKCGRLMEVDSCLLNKEIISTIRLQVEVDTIAEIPRTLALKKDEMSVLLVIEVEAPVSMVQAMEGGVVVETPIQ